MAKNGLGTTYPNPLVGSVIVAGDTIIGEGWHRKAGAPHAEVMAINSVNDRKQLEQATIYINLEPCNHHGRTPPCSDLIIASGIRNVVIGTVDPFAKVAGSGIKKLREAGCEVTVGILAEECRELNRRFFTFHTKKRPYIILKWAQSADGFLSAGNASESAEHAKPLWISNVYSRQLVHKWRSEEQAILAGTKTVLYDNPALNTRYWEGSSPVRIIIDRQLRIPKDYGVWDGSVNTVFIAEKNEQISDFKNIKIENIDFSGTIAQQICDVVYRYGLQSIIIEGGTQTLQTFIDAGLWDEARVFTGAITLKKGIKAPEFHSMSFTEQKIAGDLLHFFKNPDRKLDF